MDNVTISRPWGSFERFTLNEISSVKLLYINKDNQTSLQFHHHRNEFWKVISGHPKLIIGDVENDANPNDEFEVLREQKHRILAPVDDVIILEVSNGFFDEGDIVRLEDEYNRV